MDISIEMLEALKKRRDDEFGFYEEYIYEGINVGEIRSKIGYRGLDITKGVNVETFFVDKIRCRKYFMKSKTNHVVFNIHGGAFYGGGIDVIENPSKYMSYYGNIHVISIDYTLAPDLKFPDTMHEIYNVIKKIKKMYKDDVVFSILGDSAGAHLAYNVSMLDSLDMNILSSLVMYYPVISLNEIENFKIKDYNLDEDCINGKSVIMFLKSIMPLIKKLYLKKDCDINSEYFNLLNTSKEKFLKMPKIFLVKSGFDYFNIHIDEFIKKYNIDYIECEDLSHGFIEVLGYVGKVQQTLEITVDKIKKIKK